MRHALDAIASGSSNGCIVTLVDLEEHLAELNGLYQTVRAVHRRAHRRSR
jgi:hypothetical protein